LHSFVRTPGEGCLHPRKARRRRLLSTTETLESAIAALATIGENSWPVSGYKAPAASGIAIAL